MNVEKVALWIVLLGLAATLVVNGSGTQKAVGAVTGGFAQDITAAEKG
jgi:hypothetical protein